jgi:ABC-type iron transport system FetAB ATPase subunit
MTCSGAIACSMRNVYPLLKKVPLNLRQLQVKHNGAALRGYISQVLYANEQQHLAGSKGHGSSTWARIQCSLSVMTSLFLNVGM